MKKFVVAALVASAALSADNAGAAVVTKTYSATLQFYDGSPSVSESFMISYDPLVDGDTFRVYNHSSTGPAAVYDTPPIVGVSFAPVYVPGRYFVYIGGQGDVNGSGNTNDFGTNFEVDAAGNPQLSPYLDPTLGRIYGGANYQFADGTSVNGAVTGLTAVDAVLPAPEPATWATTLLGFGAVGGALRGRRKVAVSFG